MSIINNTITHEFGVDVQLDLSQTILYKRSEELKTYTHISNLSLHQRQMSVKELDHLPYSIEFVFCDKVYAFNGTAHAPKNFGIPKEEAGTFLQNATNFLNEIKADFDKDYSEFCGIRICDYSLLQDEISSLIVLLQGV